MVLKDEDIKKFQALYKSRFGLDISREEAYEKGIKLVRLMELVYKPMTQEEMNFIQKRRQDTLHLLLEELQQHESRKSIDQQTS
jgi:hypothetical protein